MLCGRVRLSLPVILLATLAIGTPVIAQTYPTESIRIVVPFAPGGNTDVTARLIAAQLTSSLGQGVVIENIAGAGGKIGTANVARAKTDGHTLLFASTSTLAIAPAIDPKLPFDAQRSFSPIGLVSTAPHFLFVNPNLPVRNVAELIKYAQENPDKFNYSSPGIGTPNHLAAELFLSRAGLKAVHVPYRGGAPALTAVMSGEVQFAFDTFAIVGASHQSGKVRVLAIANDRRSPLLPEIPTFREAGTAGVEASSWNGIVAPTGTPQQVVARLSLDIQKALQAKDLTTQFEKLGLEPAPMSSAEFGDFIAKEIAKWTEVAQSTGIKIE